MALVVPLVGCHNYIPIERPSPGTIVRVHIPVSGAAVGGRVIAPTSVSFEGRVVSLTDTLLLETKSRRQVGALRDYVEFDTLRVATDGLSGMEERVTSKPKTYAFTAVLIAGAAGIAAAAVKAAGGSQGEGAPGDGTIQPAVVGIVSALVGLFVR